jgi:multiple antibiotic resistance protein
MTEVLRAAASVFAAIAPLGLVTAFWALPAESADRRREMLALGSAAALLIFLLAVALTDPFLGLLDVAPESFQGAAAVIMLPLAARLLWSGRAMDPGERVTQRPWLMPLAVPAFVGPASLATVIAFTGRYGEPESAIASALALALTALVLLGGHWLQERLGDLALGVLGRLSGALIVIIAVEMAIDGVQSV